MKKIFHHKKIYQKLLFLFIFISLILFTNKGFSQCQNADFSIGDFSNWTGSTGMNSGGDYSNEVPGINQGVTNSSPTDPGQQTIMTLPATDPNTNNLLSVLPPGGSYSCRLGNELVNYGAERLKYVLNVTSSNCIFSYQYAVVLEDPNHPAGDQPKFTVDIFDSFSNLIDSLYIFSQTGMPGWYDATHAADGETDHWKDWATEQIDLTSYIGQNITLQFTTYDCAQGAHFGYAYISCYCGYPQLAQQCMGDTVIINAPIGFTSYLWNTGDTTQSIFVVNPVAGDSVSCICISANDTITLSAAVSTRPVTGLTANSATICEGDTAVITASGTYTYLWNNGQTTASISVAPSITTTYTVTATSSGGCTSSTNAVVTVHPAPTGTISSMPLACGSPTGTITITPTGGTAPYTYVWNTSPPQTTQTATGLLAGSYTVTVTDSNGCSSAITGNVASQVTINLTITSTDEHCGEADGTATVTASGGTGIYTYIWSTAPPQTTQTAINLPASTYTVTVSDGNCTATATTMVNNLPGPSAQITNIVNTSCGMNDGSATVIVTGATPPITYTWNTTPPQTTQTLQNVFAGYYCVTVTDAYCYCWNCVTIIDTAYPAPDICMVTVDTATNQNRIIWEKPVTAGIDQYYIYRESSISGIYNLIGAQSYSNFSTYLDITSNSLQQAYRYKLAIHDNCGNTSALSSYHQTIHLAVSPGTGGSWNLIWNDYIGFSFSTYNIYRGSSSSNMTLLNSVASSVTSYTDVSPPPGTLHYLIEAVNPSSCNPSLKSGNSFASTISNIASTNGVGINELSDDENIQIYPNPANEEITVAGTSLCNSHMEIINSLGQMIYSDELTSQIKTIDISDFPKGIYFLSIKGKTFISYKIIEIE